MSNPNPLQSTTTLNLEGVDSNSRCQIRDSRGRIIESIQATEITTWDASKLNSGIYLVELFGKKGKTVKKVILD